MPGCGDSEEPKTGWDLDKYISFIIKFIEKLNIKELDLIGHSNGGKIIIKLMSNKNLNFTVGKIILIGSSGVVHKKSFKQKLKIKLFKILKKILQLKLIQKFFPHLITSLKNNMGSEDYRNATPIMRDTLVKLVNTDVTEYLKDINRPTLLIWGEQDTATPISDGEIMEKLIPDAGLVRIPKCSHYVFVEQAGYVNKIIYTFLNGKG